MRYLEQANSQRHSRTEVEGLGGVGQYCLMVTEFVWEGEKGLEIDSGAGCTALWIYLLPPNGTFAVGPHGRPLAVLCWTQERYHSMVPLHVQRRRGRHLYQTHILLTEVLTSLHRRVWGCMCRTKRKTVIRPRERLRKQTKANSCWADCST